MQNNPVIERKVRDGKVMVNGGIYAVSEQYVKYDGRLDGLKLLFCAYTGEKRFIALLGAKKRGRTFEGEPWIVDNCNPWMTWNKVADASDVGKEQ